MRAKYDDVIRAAVALQTATFELMDSDIDDKVTLRAMVEVQKELNRRIKLLLANIA